MSPGTDVSGNYKVLHGKTDVNNTPANQCADARTTAYITGTSHETFQHLPPLSRQFLFSFGLMNLY
jgi:hypothetical protein